MFVHPHNLNWQIVTDGLLQNTRILTAQIHNVLLEIQAVTIGATRDGAPQTLAATVNNSSEILTSWVKRLPLVEVQEYLDFNEMLLEHPSVANEIVINSIKN
jgi:hypothetical protein